MFEDDITDDFISMISEIANSKGIDDDEDVQEVCQSLRTTDTSPTPSEPKTVKEAWNSDEGDAWKHATDEEHRSLRERGTWTVVDRPKDKPVIKGKWVFKRKLNQKGKIERYKARWVARGFTQRYGIDYTETYAGVVRAATTRALFAIAALYDWEIDQCDMKTAYLNGDIVEEIYVEMPHGYEEGDKVCKLRKGLYGLKQSARLWQMKLKGTLTGMGFKQSKKDPCLYFKGDLKRNGVVITTHVDDIQYYGPDHSEIQRTKRRLGGEFEMSDQGASSYYLGMEIARNRREKTLKLTQSMYTKRMLQGHSMVDGKKICRTPMEPNTTLTASEGIATPSETTRYQARIGSVMHLATMTRPDIAFSTNKMSQFSTNPGERHFAATKRQIRYLRGTQELGLSFGFDRPEGTDQENDLGLTVWSDASYGDNVEDSKSTGAYVVMLNGGLVSWSSRKQSIVATSTAEAEYIAAADAAKEAIWLRELLIELSLWKEDQPVKINCDNESAVTMTKNDGVCNRSKHVRMRYHFVKDEINNGTIRIGHVPASTQLADPLTKPLGAGGVEYFTTCCNMKRTIKGPTETSD
jgi:hypothetical protein